MTVQQPSELPRWADNPPVPPPSTITDPASGEKDVGFQPGVQAQVDDFVISNVISTAGHTYNATVNGVAANFTTVGGDTLGSIIAGLVSALNGIGQPITASATGTAARVTANVAGQAFVSTTTDGANVTINNVQANKSNKPIRQYLNWLFNTIYQWILFWFYTIFQLNDLITQPYDVASAAIAPSTTVGTLVGSSGSAVSYIPNGLGVYPFSRRAVGVAESHTYGANQDTYVDLHFDGSWVYNPVANNASAPSIGAHDRRQWKVVTNGVQITSVVDLRNTMIQTFNLWDFGDPVTFGGGTTTKSDGSGLDQPATQVTVSDSFSYSLMSEWAPAGAGFGGVRLYATGSGGLAVAIGCQWNQTGQAWYFDAGAIALSNPSHATLFVSNYLGGWITYRKSVSGATTSTHWLDSFGGDPIGAGAWDDAKQTNFGELVLGGGLTNNATEALLARLIANKVSSGTSPRTLLIEDKGGSGTLRVYLSNNGAVDDEGGPTMGPCIEIVQNAAWTSGSNVWTQDAAGRTTKTEIGQGGLKVLSFTSGSPTTLTDTIDDLTNWTYALMADATNGDLHGLTADALTVVGLTVADRITITHATDPVTPSVNTLFKGNLGKASGGVICNGSGGFLLNSGFNVSGMAFASAKPGGVRVTLATPFASSTYYPTVSLMSDGLEDSSDPSVHGYTTKAVRIDSQNFDVYVHSALTGALVTLSASGGAHLGFSFHCDGTQ